MWSWADGPFTVNPVYHQQFVEMIAPADNAQFLLTRTRGKGASIFSTHMM